MREIKKEVLEEPQPLETEGYQIYHIKEEDVEEDDGVDGENKDLQEKPHPEGQQVFIVKQEYIEDDHGLDNEAVDLAEGVVEEPHSSGTEGYRFFFVKEEDFEDDRAEMQISYEQDDNPQPRNSELRSNQLPSRGDKEEDGSSGYKPETEVGGLMSNTSKQDVRSTKPGAESRILKQDSFIIPVPSSGMRLNAELQTPVDSSRRETSCVVGNYGFEHTSNEGDDSQQRQEVEEDPVNILRSYREWGKVNECGHSNYAMHELQQPFQYPDCDKLDTIKSDVIVHVKNHTAKNPHSFDSHEETNLTRDLRTHTKQCYQETHIAESTSTPSGENSCPYCNKMLNCKSKLSCHVRTHTGEKVYQCVHCDKKLAMQSALTPHMQTHKGEKPHQCVHCDKKFAQQSTLTRHIQTHTGEKPYQCVHCDKKFAQKGDLTSHMRTHTGEKPYYCVLCNKKFAQRSHVSSHLQIHTGEKPYQCVHCDKKFASKSNLTRHIRIHTRS